MESLIFPTDICH